jgi:LPS export ABC transporter permease LptF/LPS export ABC transporter permease LptG
VRSFPLRLERYVFREVLSPTILGLALYILVFLMNALFDMAELVIKKDIPLHVVGRLLGYLMPRILEMTLPMALLLGILIGIGRLSADSELIALRASGVSYRRVLLPVMALAGILFAGSLALCLFAEPQARYLQRRLYNEQLYSADLRREIKPRVFFEQVPGLLVYADDVYQEGDFLGRVFLHQTDAEGREVVTLAHRAQIGYNRKEGVVEFLLESGTNHTMTPGEPESYQISHFDRQRIVRGPDDTFRMKMGILSRPSPRNYSEQNISELRGSIVQSDSLEAGPTKDRVVGTIRAEIHSRWSLPFACLTLAFLGLPLGIANRRGGKGSGFTVSICVVIAYWLMSTSGLQLVREGHLSPWIGIWGPHAILVALGLVLFLSREQTEGLNPAVLIPLRFRCLLQPRRTASAWNGTGDPSLTGMPQKSKGWRIVVGLMTVLIGIGAVVLTPFLTVGLLLLVSIVSFSTTLDRDILKRFLLILVGCIVSFFTVFLVWEFVGILDDMMERQQPVTLMLTYLAYRMPWILAQVTPMSCLMAALLTYGLMSRFNEVTAVKAGGTSIYRLSVPVILATLVTSVLAYVNYDYVVPFSNQEYTRIKDTIRGRSPRSYAIGDRRWVFGAGGRLFNFRNYVAPAMPSLPAAQNGGVFEGFSVYLLDPATFDMRGRLYARSAVRDASGWVLREGWVREFGGKGEVFERFTEKRFDFPENEGFFVKEWKKPEQMNFSELRRLINDLKHRGYDAQELQVDLYSKTSFPLVPLTLVILGLPFCFRLGRHGSLYGIAIAILLAGIYFLLFSATSALGGTGLMPAFLAAWAPNILFIGAGTYLLLKTGT